ncbi:MAG: peptidase T [Bacillota bacterium]|nr:peptidase T [Bacillota bacterium]
MTNRTSPLGTWLHEQGLEAPSTSALDRFLRYVAIDTQADEEAAAAGHFPSSPGQLELGRLLVAELAELGVTAEQDENGYVFASIPARHAYPAAPTLGLIAHLDTATELGGRATGAHIVRYDGTPILLNHTAVAADPATPPVHLDAAVFPQLAGLEGHDLVVTDGTTLLGADDKAGIAAILGLVDILARNPGLPHPALAIGFTPDEEIGRGAERFDITAFGADVAYTLDGGAAGELEIENFNAAAARVTVHGRSVHPGSAKDRMRNAILIARRFSLAFDERQTPEHTEDREGFWHLLGISGTVETCTLDYIIRDFDANSFDARKARLQTVARALNDEFGETVVEVALREQYRNMIEHVSRHPELVERARAAMRLAGVEALEQPIRGGTDGAHLSARGLPCPNLFTGAGNAHGRYEYLDIDAFERSQLMLVHLVRLFAAAEAD